MRRPLAVIAYAFLQCWTPAAMALGFGPVTNATRLGQPLDFTVAVKLDGALSEPCVVADVTAGETRIPSSQVRTRLVRSGNRNDALVRITSTTRVREPVVTIVLSLGCPPRVAHKFVSLLDPAPAAPRSEPVARSIVPVVAAAPLVAATTAPAAPASAAAPAAAPPSVDTTDPRVRDRERMLALQDRVERLREDQQAMAQSVAALQARLRESERVRHDPALYGLATLVVLLLGVVAALLWRLWRQRSDAVWLEDGRAMAASGSRAAPAHAMSPAAVAPHEEVTQSSMRIVPDSSFGGPATVPPPAAADPLGPITTIPETARVRRELTADELIDLEQQADFFIALGQEESAIDLLMAHVRSSGGTSPMPYLKLLGIYRRRGEAEAYERVRERFNRRFNVHAAAWAIDPAQGRPLEDYPEIVARVQRAWATPVRAADLLEALLFRRDPLQAGFDLPAYEELLLLYALTKDLADMENNPDGVDLLLPLEMGTAQPAITHVAAAVLAPEARPAKPVDLELDFGGPSPTPAAG